MGTSHIGVKQCCLASFLRTFLRGRIHGDLRAQCVEGLREVVVIPCVAFASFCVCKLTQCAFARSAQKAKEKEKVSSWETSPQAIEQQTHWSSKWWRQRALEDWFCQIANFQDSQVMIQYVTFLSFCPPLFPSF